MAPDDRESSRKSSVSTPPAPSSISPSRSGWVTYARVADEHGVRVSPEALGRASRRSGGGLPHPFRRNRGTRTGRTRWWSGSSVRLRGAGSAFATRRTMPDSSMPFTAASRNPEHGWPIRTPRSSSNGFQAPSMHRPLELRLASPPHSRGPRPARPVSNVSSSRARNGSRSRTRGCSSVSARPSASRPPASSMSATTLPAIGPEPRPPASARSGWARRRVPGPSS